VVSIAPSFPLRIARQAPPAWGSHGAAANPSRPQLGAAEPSRMAALGASPCDGIEPGLARRLRAPQAPQQPVLPLELLLLALQVLGLRGCLVLVRQGVVVAPGGLRGSKERRPRAQAGPQAPLAAATVFALHGARSGL
jgi:hypothetical protein